MPRPPKRVAPDTLGGRIRAARQELHLALAEVAGGRYSTSLISQIERNRVDPSQESLRYLAERLKLPLEDLVALAQQQRNSEAEVGNVKVYEEQRMQAELALGKGRPQEALHALADLPLAQIPVSTRWRLAALRGQANFTLRRFALAQRELLTAVDEKPEHVPAEQQLEVMVLSLSLAASCRELGQLKDALRQYQHALTLMHIGTPLRYIAEAHACLAFTAYELARQEAEASGLSEMEGRLIELALSDAESARTLYHAIGDELRAGALSCEIGLMLQTTGRLSEARTLLRGVLDQWQQGLAEPVDTTPVGNRQRQERANVVSAAACYLAGVELEDGQYQEALSCVHQAEDAGRHSSILRRAEAAMMLGKILEAHPQCNGEEAEQAFRRAVQEVESTDRLATRILAHDLLGRHLLKSGKISDGERELNRARALSHFVPSIGSALTPDSGNGVSPS